MSLDLQRVDYGARLEAWQQRKGYFYELNRQFVHGRYLPMSVAGGEVSEEMMDHILRQLLTYYSATAESDEQYEREKARIVEMWPAAVERMKQDPGLAQLMLGEGCWSRNIFPFLYDIWFQPAVAFLPGFGLAHTVTDDFEPLPFSDRLVTYTADCTFGMEKYRTEAFQPHVRQARRVLLLGGGVAPVLWTRKYPLGQLDQEIIIYDTNPKMPEYLEKLIGRPLKDVGIEYRVADALEAAADPKLRQWADFVDAAGLAPYFDNRAQEFYGALGQLVKPGGLVGFDHTIMNPTFGFVVKTCHWQTPFQVEPDAQTARLKAEQYVAYGKLRIVHTQVGPANAPVSVVFLAQPK